MLRLPAGTSCRLDVVLASFSPTCISRRQAPCQVQNIKNPRRSALLRSMEHAGRCSAAEPDAADTSLDAPPDSPAGEANNLPRSPLEMVHQAADCLAASMAQGQLRHTVELLLPINEKERNFQATEADDYPCSLQKEFDVACALATSLLRRALGDPGAEVSAQRLDDGGVEGEPCALMLPQGRHLGRIAAVVYPTSDRLPQIRQLAEKAERALVLVNPQWREEGQVISDFGIGPWKKAALDFLAQFQATYSLKERRIGSPGTIDTVTGTRFGSGGVVRVLHRWPGPFEAYATAADGSSQMMAATAQEPSYNELDAMITEGKRRKLPIFRLARMATYVYADEPQWQQDRDSMSADAAAPSGGAAAGPGEAGGGQAGLSDSDIEALDAASLRRLLASYGEPTSGKISKLRERLREAAAKA